MDELGSRSRSECECKSESEGDKELVTGGVCL